MASDDFKTMQLLYNCVMRIQKMHEHPPIAWSPSLCLLSQSEFIHVNHEVIFTI